MSKPPRTWRCQRVRGGVKCATDNLRVKQKCTKCGGKRPPHKSPVHRQILNEVAYEQAVAVFGERCAICGRSPKPGKKLHRDHGHSGKSVGKFRALLCFQCNVALRDYMDADFLRAALIVVERAELPGHLNMSAFL